MPDNLWLLLMLAVFAETGATYEDILKKEEENRKRLEYEQQLQQCCGHIEWEQDMQMQIPFCKLDGEICNMQCIRNKGGK